MKERHTNSTKRAGERCSGCDKPVASYECVQYGSIEKGYRLLCWRCFNTEAARADGLERFQHLDFEPVRIVDCDGRPHDFHFRTRIIGVGAEVALDAFELRNGYPAGYMFQIIGDAEGDLLALLGRLVERMRRALAVKHLQQGSLGLKVAGEVVRGRIEWDEAAGGRVPRLIIDGREITWEHFGQMLMTFEGWQFKLSILDKSQES